MLRAAEDRRNLMRSSVIGCPMTCYIILDTTWAECGGLSEYSDLSIASYFIESTTMTSVSETYQLTVAI
jgi:hypothetical protein